MISGESVVQVAQQTIFLAAASVDTIPKYDFYIMPDYNISTTLNSFSIFINETPQSFSLHFVINSK